MALADLIGTWKLLSHQFVTTDNKDRLDMFGPAPLGILIITPDQRLIAIITAKDRKPADSDSDLFKSALAYSGPFRIDGQDLLVTTVDIAWFPGWQGTEQARKFAINGNILTMSTPVAEHPAFPGRTARGLLTWQRA